MMVIRTGRHNWMIFPTGTEEIVDQLPTTSWTKLSTTSIMLNRLAL